MSENWCEHITKKEGYYVLKKSHESCVSLSFDERVNFCPICAAKRPEKEKSLADQAKTVYDCGRSWIEIEYYFRKWAIEQVEKCFKHKPDKNSAWVQVEELIPRLKGEDGGE